MSSRPHASVDLRLKATIKVDILGFTEEERHLYIKQSFKGQPQAIEELTHYLQDHISICNVCLVPFNLVILFKMGIPLPRDSSQLHHHFIYFIIRRHLAKHGHQLKDDIKKLANLPEPYNKIVKSLSKLALQALNKNQLIFTHDEIKTAYPDIVTTPEAVNGFGLLQAVQHFAYSGKTITFNFLNLTIQEYLAAQYIINDTQQHEEWPSHKHVCHLCYAHQRTTASFQRVFVWWR